MSGQLARTILALKELKQRRDQFEATKPLYEAELLAKKKEIEYKKAVFDRIRQASESPQAQQLTDAMNQMEQQQATPPGVGVLPPDVLDMMTSLQGQQQGPQPQPQPQQQAQGLPQAGNSGGIAALMMDPNFLTMAKMAGFDFTGISNNLVNQQNNAFKNQMSLANYMLRLQGQGFNQGISQGNLDVARSNAERGWADFGRRGTEYNLVDQALPGGGSAKIALPKFPGEAGAIPAITTKLSPNDAPVVEVSNWFNKDTLEHPPAGELRKDLQDNNFINIKDANTVTKLNNIKETQGIVNGLSQLMENVFPKNESELGRVSGGASRAIGSFLQTDMDATNLQGLINLTEAAFVKMYQSGTLSDQDMRTARKGLVKLTDRADVAWGKIKVMQDLINKKKEALLGKTSSPSLGSFKKESTGQNYSNDEMDAMIGGK